MRGTTLATVLVVGLMGATAAVACSSPDDSGSDGGTGGIDAAGGAMTTGGASNCGNNVLDPGETCDPPGSCNTDCNDGDYCTTDLLQGTPLTCNAQCIHNPKTACESNDSCCPPGCSAPADNDCTTSPGAGGGTSGGGAGGTTGGVGATGGGGTGGAAPSTGGTAGTGGTTAGTGGATAGTGGTTAGTGGTTAGTGGTTAGTGGQDGTGGNAAGAGGQDGTGGQVTVADGPCDIYADAGTPCAAAYSMIRRLSSTYTGPLYQVRAGSNAQNTGTGGTPHDIGQTADGFGDAAAQDAVCANTTCTISILYDQSGMGNDIIVGTRGNSAGGEWADDDDFETIADAGPLTVAGHSVYSLYMDTRQGYRSPVGSGAGNGMPVGNEPQGIYMLADGTHYGTACCWDFGNVTSTPGDGGWHFMDTLFFGTAYWGMGAGNGPWFGNDMEAGIWMGGSNPGDPGWGALNDTAPPNPNNPSLRVPFAIGFTKASTSAWALRMADLQTANSLTDAYEGPLPQGKVLDHQGAIVLGVGGDNSNNSWGTFFEGAIVAGYPAAATEDAILANVKAVGYGQ